jgi:hypothetical protein
VCALSGEMSEPVVQRALRKMPYKTSLTVVFFTALFAIACSGAIAVYSPEIWDSAGCVVLFFPDKLNEVGHYSKRDGHFPKRVQVLELRSFCIGFISSFHIFRAGMSGAGVGVMLGFVPGLLVDRATPMLAAFLFAGECFAGYFVLFFVAKGILVISSWVVIGVLFFLVGQACVG